ncbi:MAG TPA: Omp28-related outer membrane protein [Salinivirgaceae bacterium]|nr:Omp28-related outer membrane protein [Salinivirgaceae bacterium]
MKKNVLFLTLVAIFMCNSLFAQLLLSGEDAISNNIAQIEEVSLGENQEISSVVDVPVTAKVPALVAQRKVLLEQFTTELCGYCPGGAARIKSVIEQPEFAGKVHWVAHHAGFYTDSYTIPESQSYLRLYGSGGTYAPAMMLDRTIIEGSAPVMGIPTTTTGIANYFRQALNTPTSISVNITQANTIATDRKVKITAYGEDVSGTPSAEDLYVVIYLLENNITSTTQNGAGGTYIHNNLIRKVMNDAVGTQIVWHGNAYGVTAEATLPTGWNAENMDVVAFVTKNYMNPLNNVQVLNAEKTELTMEESGTYEITFHAAHNGTPMEGVTINVDDNVTTTNAQGNATLQLVNGGYAYTATKEGYVGKGFFVVNNAGLIVEVTMSIPYEVTFHAAHNGTPLEEVTINVADTVITTNGEGNASLQLINGNYPYTATKEGFDDYEGNIVVENTAQTVELEMVRSICKVTFRAVDDGTPLEGVTINVADTVLTTNVQGRAIIQLISGTYAYTATKEGYDDCEGSIVVKSSAQIVNLNMTVGVEGVAVESIVLLYPNPIERTLTIERSSNDEVVMEIYNIYGALVSRMKTDNVTTTIDVGMLSSGSYFVRIVGANETTVHRFIKK